MPAAPDHAIVSSRVFPVSRETLFNAWKDPVLLAQWWGPEGFTNVFHAFDWRPGGLWKFTMRGPDGAEYHNQSIFQEMTEPERIVLRHLEPMHAFTATATFAESEPDRTLLTFRMEFDTAEDLAKALPYVPAANEQNFDRLERVVGVQR